MDFYQYLYFQEKILMIINYLFKFKLYLYFCLFTTNNINDYTIWKNF